MQRNEESNDWPLQSLRVWFCVRLWDMMPSLLPECFLALIPDRNMNCTRVIALITSLLLLAGQVAALVHAADHPFHAPDEICTSFASLEQNEHALAVLPSSSRSPHCNGETEAALTRGFSSHTLADQRARAPPLHT
jgi:hypothetical protein